jgi:hypothetical protein
VTPWDVMFWAGLVVIVAALLLIFAELRSDE